MRTGQGERDGKSASSKGTESSRPNTSQDISSGLALAPPEEMNVRNTKLGTEQLFYRWLKWAKEEK